MLAVVCRFQASFPDCPAFAGLETQTGDSRIRSITSLPCVTAWRADFTKQNDRGSGPNHNTVAVLQGLYAYRV